MTKSCHGQLLVDLPLDELRTFSLNDAIPCHYRFIEIQSFLKDGRLSVLHMPDLPSEPYAAVSYVWRVLKPIAPSDAAFSVKNIEDYPKIPIDILNTVCIAASALNCGLLWLDKLCIRQDGKLSQEGRIDNAWQVEHMFKIYSNCNVCLALPGGLGLLAAIDEKTVWLERAWTLQESLAPPIVKIIFAWDKGPAILQHNYPVFVQEVVPGKAATVDLKSLLEASLKPEVKLIRDNHDEKWENIPSQDLRILGHRKDYDGSLIMALLGALEHTNENGRLNAIWRCTILRSAKLPQDMLYSIMGLMDITLSVNYDEALEDIVIKFTMNLLAKGYAADWLGIAPSLGPHLTKSAMPILPRPGEKGGAYIEVKPGSWVEVKKLLSESHDNWWWWLKNAPKGKVDPEGFLTFVARAMSITQSDENTSFVKYTLQKDHLNIIIQCSNSSAWILSPRTETSSYAVVIGHKEQYSSGIFSKFVFPNSTLLMIVECSDGESYRNIGYAWANEEISENWSERQLKVGG